MSEGGDRHRPAAGRAKPAPHRGQGDVTEHALAAEPQAEEGEPQHRDVGREGEAETGCGEGERDQRREPSGPDRIGKRAAQEQQRRRGEGGHGVETAPLAVAQPVHRPDLAGEEGNEPGLAERAGQREQKSGAQPAGVVTEEGDHPRALSLRGALGESPV